ncbi:hypothetical protein [Methanocaldococcus sp.]
MLLVDRLSVDEVVYISLKSLKEKARRLPIHSIHRWWSRRFSATYRGILSAYLLNEKEKDIFYKGFDYPGILNCRANGKIFFEPFCGGGTGLVEAYMYGYNVFGIDVNPVATRIAETTLSLLSNRYKINNNDYVNTSIRILDELLFNLRDFWIYNNCIVSYIFITKNRVPSWVDTYRKNNKEHYIIRCPKCSNIFETTIRRDEIYCPNCEESFKMTYKPMYKINKKNLPKATKFHRIWAVELRDPNLKWKKIVMSIETNESLYKWIYYSSEKARNLKFEIEEEFPIWKLKEGKRLKKEGITKLDELYTWKQLVTFKMFAEKTKNLPKLYKLLYSLALSETAKSSSILAKWYSPIGEPVPAGAMKTFWVPEYTVETNPIAHVPNKLKPLARNTLASSIRTQTKIFKCKIQNVSSSKYSVILGDSEIIEFPKNIDLAVVDPPYLDSVQSYASISLIHYGALKIYDKFANFENENRNCNLLEVEKKEISRDIKQYKPKITKILIKIRKSLNENGRIVFLYNRINYEDWKIIAESFKDANLYPTAIYWILGESPGRLARSKLRGIFAIILSKTPNNEINIVFEEAINKFMKMAEDQINIDKEVEKMAYDSMIKSILSVYN